MYIDGVILFSLAVIALIVWMMAYIGVYAYKHIKKDIAEHTSKIKKPAKKPLEKFNGLA